jgi:hypothetical protein
MPVNKPIPSGVGGGIPDQRKAQLEQQALNEIQQEGV